MNKRVITLILILSGINFINPEVKSDGNPKNKVHTVVLDAGHGGMDPGALGRISSEKDIVLSITLKIGKYIEENFDDVKVIYTRDKDVFIPLHERANIANQARADLFISIHANSSNNSHVYGTETYAMGEHRSEQNLEVAMKENSVITLEEDYTVHYEGFDPSSAESYIIFSLMQNIHLDQSLTFASIIQDQFRERAKRIDRGVKQDIFLVLWRTTMPSVLIETGFISNTSEEKYLMSEQGQGYLASAIFRAFKDYKRTIESKSIFTTTPVIDDTSTVKNNSGVQVPGNEIIFMVQIASSANQLDAKDKIFSEFDKITMIMMDNLWKYAVGSFENYEKANEYSIVVSKNYPGAFVIAVKNNKIIPLKEALDR